MAPMGTFCLLFSERERDSRSLYAIARPPVCRLSSVCNVRAPYAGGSNFRQYFYGIRYLGHPLTSTENFTEIVPGAIPTAISQKRCLGPGNTVSDGDPGSLTEKGSVAPPTHFSVHFALARSPISAAAELLYNRATNIHSAVYVMVRCRSVTSRSSIATAECINQAGYPPLLHKGIRVSPKLRVFPLHGILLQTLNLANISASQVLRIFPRHKCCQLSSTVASLSH